MMVKPATEIAPPSNIDFSCIHEELVSMLFSEKCPAIIDCRKIEA
jgi:hypothetical protein